MSGRIVMDVAERDAGKIVVLTIDNVAKHNVLSSVLMEQLVSSLDHASASPRVRAIVLTGAGDQAFVGGADIAELMRLRPVTARVFISRAHRCFTAIRAAPAPVIARIDGHCYGLGMVLAAACDLRVATRRSRFGMPDVKLGVPCTVEAALLPQLIGWGRTRELTLLGETYPADDAARWGFLERLAEDNGIDGAVDAIISSILTGGPHAIRLQKDLIGHWETQPLQQAVMSGVDAFARAYDTEEPAHMMAHFMAMRAARKSADAGTDTPGE